MIRMLNRTIFRLIKLSTIDLVLSSSLTLVTFEFELLFLLL